MLVLSRKEAERIRLGNSIVVTVIRVSGDKVRLGIEAPADMLVLRDELEIRLDVPEVEGVQVEGVQVESVQVESVQVESVQVEGVQVEGQVEGVQVEGQVEGVQVEVEGISTPAGNLSQEKPAA